MGARSSKDLAQLAAVVQTNLYTPNSTFANTNVLPVLDNLTWNNNSAATKVKNTGTKGQRKSVARPTQGDVTFSYPMKGGGVLDSYGKCFDLLEASCWTPSTAVGVRTWIPTDQESLWKAFTMRYYSGNLDASKSSYEQFENCMFNTKFMFDWAEGEAYSKIEYSGIGDYNGVPTLGSQLVETVDTVDIDAIFNVTLDFFGDSDYDLLKLEIDSGVELALSRGPNKRYAYRTKQEVKWSATVYKDDLVAPGTAFRNGTTGVIDIQWGASPNVIQLATGAGKAQIETCVSGEDNGIETWELTGIVIDNDISLSVDSN